MSWTLGGVTLKNPVSFNRKQVEIAKTNLMLDGTSKKDYIRQKEVFEIGLEKLTQAQVADIIALFNGKVAVDFAVSETNLTIASTQVFININERTYATKGNEYRENIKLVLEEV